MTRRHMFFGMFVLLIGIIGLLVFLRLTATLVQPDFSKSTEDGTSPELPEVQTKFYRTDLHPLSDPKVREAYLKRCPESWEDWAKSLYESMVGSGVETGHISTSDQVESMLMDTYDQLMEQAALYDQKNHPLPDSIVPMPYLNYSYKCPQTPEALIAEFDSDYTGGGWGDTALYTHDESFPRAAFLQRLLDKGGVIRDLGDYSFYMGLRGDLLKKKEQPTEWASGKYGIPITTNFAEYEEGFLSRKIWENGILHQVSEANPDESVTIYFPSIHSDKYLPVIGKMTYVRLNKNRDSINTSGTKLTSKQRDNLLHKGIEPEDIEIIYIDGDYNLIDPPPLVDPNDLRAKNIVAIDGVKVTPENYEQLMARPIPGEWIENYQKWTDYEEQVSASSVASDVNIFKRHVAERAAYREAAKAEFERFQHRMQQLESFATMSDAEIEKQLERQFRKQFLPEHPVEQLEQITPERLERALGTLFKYGFEDGMRHIREDNAALADQLERHFGKRAKPPAQELKPPQKPTPPKLPSEPPASSDETQ